MYKNLKVILRNPLDKTDLLDYDIELADCQLAQDWAQALKDLLIGKYQIEKNFCFMGFPYSARNLGYLCQQLNDVVYRINLFNRTGQWQNAGLPSYIIEEFFTPDVVRFGDEYPVGYDDSNLGLGIKHGVMNVLHNHFEILQGTVWSLSEYYRLADYETKYAIRQLNNICHEIESLCLSQRRQATTPEFTRPSQITTFLQAPRLDLKTEHRQGFLTNGYDRRLGGVYMHWTQIGKTLFEVFRDEHAPDLTATICEAITELKYYSGEFDIEWGADVVYGSNTPWHDQDMDEFYQWLQRNNRDRNDPMLSLGYLPLGQVNLRESFGTIHPATIQQMLSKHLDIYKIEIDGVSETYDYCWTDLDYKQQQINHMRSGYDHSSRG
jgi:ribonucleotide reductase beta subunit family protein with ferritin-like domain